MTDQIAGKKMPVCCWPVALPGEVAAYVDGFAGVRGENGRRSLVRDGAAQPRAMVASAGAVEVITSAVNGKHTDPVTDERMRLSPVTSPPLARATPRTAQVPPPLSARHRRRMVSAPHRVALVRTWAWARGRFECGVLAGRPEAAAA